MLHGWRVLQLLIFFLWCCGPAASRGTHFGKKWYNKQQRRRDVNIGTTTASARRKDWSLYWFIVTASPSVCLRVGRNYDGLVSWWMKMKTCLIGTVFLSKYTVPHTHGHATWEQTRFVIQSRNMLLFFFFLFRFVCLVANWSSSFTAEITTYISQADGSVFEWVGEVCSGGSNEEALMKWKWIS
jgi:hypothetical protein